MTSFPLVSCEEMITGEHGASRILRLPNASNRMPPNIAVHAEPLDLKFQAYWGAKLSESFRSFALESGFVHLNGCLCLRSTC
jgi:hypothetical protein